MARASSLQKSTEQNGLPHTAADPNAHSVRKTLLKEYGLPHTIAYLFNKNVQPQFEDYTHVCC